MPIRKNTGGLLIHYIALCTKQIIYSSTDYCKTTVWEVGGYNFTAPNLYELKSKTTSLCQD
jgi:hypothetical protein